MPRRPPDPGLRSSRTTAKRQISITEARDYQPLRESHGHSASGHRPHAEPDHDPYAGARVGEASHPGPYRRPRRREPVGLDASGLSSSSSSASSWAATISMPSSETSSAPRVRKLRGKAPPTQERPSPPRRPSPKASLLLIHPHLSRVLESWRPRRPRVTLDSPPSQSPSLEPRRSGPPSRSGSRNLSTAKGGLGCTDLLLQRVPRSL